MIGGVTRRIRDTSNSHKIHFGRGFALLLKVK